MLLAIACAETVVVTARVMFVLVDVFSSSVSLMWTANYAATIFQWGFLGAKWDRTRRSVIQITSD